MRHYECSTLRRARRENKSSSGAHVADTCRRHFFPSTRNWLGKTSTKWSLLCVDWDSKSVADTSLSSENSTRARRLIRRVRITPHISSHRDRTNCVGPLSVVAAANRVASRRTTRFSAAVTNHGARGSDEMGSDEVK